MNPPFTRSVGGNLLFGNMPDHERAAMQFRLKKIIHQHGLKANATAGLGSPFVAIAHPLIRPHGRLALVLPKAVLSGGAWRPTQELLNDQYALEYVVVSHEPGHYNFSENTDLGECLVVARKKADADPEDKAVFLNLWHNPRNQVEALSLTRTAQSTKAIPMLLPDARCINLGDDQRQGQAFAVALPDTARGPWSLWCGFAQADLIAALHHMRSGHLRLPRLSALIPVPVAPLESLAQLGPDCRDIHDGFRRVSHQSHYGAFWDHDTKAVRHMGQEPNATLEPLSKAKPGRHLRRASDLWPLAGRILLVERMRLNTVRAPAIRVNREVLSNVWWPIRLLDHVRHPGAEEALVLWFNSTLGLLSLIGHRTETAGAWSKFKKPMLYQMPVLNVAVLSGEQLSALRDAFDGLSSRDLSPLPNMATDSVRKAIDEAIELALDLPALSLLRDQLSWEPAVCQTNDRLLKARSPQLSLEL